MHAYVRGGHVYASVRVRLVAAVTVAAATVGVAFWIRTRVEVRPNSS